MTLDFTNALNEIGQLVEDATKENLTINGSVGTGDLRRSIKYEVISPTEVEIGTNKEYAIYVEMGTGLFAENGDGRKEVPWHYQDASGEWHSTVGQHPKPFLRPALDLNKDLIEKIIQEDLDAQLKEAISK